MVERQRTAWTEAGPALSYPGLPGFGRKLEYPESPVVLLKEAWLLLHQQLHNSWSESDPSCSPARLSVPAETLSALPFIISTDKLHFDGNGMQMWPYPAPAETISASPPGPRLDAADVNLDSAARHANPQLGPV